ncbi:MULTISPECIES: hypothetical protein [unclassified Sinorhizobium]|nr:MULTISPECIES: hypothetical protein [unclassified Sinorhizobium]MDK1377712.1 hypothetical protein [Sinorhizobium sp. 6-70]MDK1478672.1 hypothetical protein [Sinorhizobium sp. 6-117]
MQQFKVLQRASRACKTPGAVVEPAKEAIAIDFAVRNDRASGG